MNNIFKKIRNIFLKGGQTEFGQSITSDFEQYAAMHWGKIEVESEKFIRHYGNNFENFFYRADFADFLRKEVFEFRNPSYEDNDFLENNHWKTKHPYNFPGPFYTDYESDTSATGIGEAPNNVLNDKNSLEYIFKQPKTFVEFLCVIDAASVEIFYSYTCNGNDHWTYLQCKLWWKNKNDLLNELNKDGEAKEYIEYLNSSAETDLRRYCYFLENGIYPKTEIVNLPTL